MGHEIPWSEDILPEFAAPRVVEAFIELLGEAWEVVKGECSSEMIENDITDKIVAWMQIRLRDAGWWVTQQSKPPAVKYIPGAKTFGFCDITIQIRSKSVIFECKRLNITREDGSFVSQATLYVKEGMYRHFFPEENSKKNTPQYPALDGQSGMIGYVMNGIATDAFTAVTRSIKNYTSPQTFSSPHAPCCPSYGSYRFLTIHLDCTGKLIQTHHILLPIV